MKHDFMFTSESVTEGHPDKLCDQISDAIVDAFLVADPRSKIVAECAASTGILFLAARFASEATLDIADIARRTVHQIGYQSGSFNARDATIMTSFQQLPSEMYCELDDADMDDAHIDRMVPRNHATVFGYACNQTPALMPLPITLAHRLARRLAAARLQKQLTWLAPDGQTQVGVEYRERRPRRIHSITLVASQASADSPSVDQLRDELMEHVIRPAFRNEILRPDDTTRILINPFGPVVEGGPALHAGLTGRKNAVDTYGEYARHGGSALSGKDPCRIDRIGAYAARHAAKNVVAAGLAEECEIALSYSIGLAAPVSVQVETFGTGTVDDEEIGRRIDRVFDFRLGAIIRDFRLRHLPARDKGGFYRKLAAYGHVGRQDLGLPWEQTALSERLR